MDIFTNFLLKKKTNKQTNITESTFLFIYLFHKDNIKILLK